MAGIYVYMSIYVKFSTPWGGARLDTRLATGTLGLVKGVGFGRARRTSSLCVCGLTATCPHHNSSTCPSEVVPRAVKAQSLVGADRSVTCVFLSPCLSITLGKRVAWAREDARRACGQTQADRS